jgi:hypothetical protein
VRFKSIAVFLLLIGTVVAHAQHPDPLLLSVSLERTQGIFIKEEVFQKAILLKSEKSSGIALLIFRGWPGIAKIEAPKDWWRNLNYMQNQVPLFLDAGISMVVMDCPTDQQAFVDRANPVSCDDGYRSSMQHASDVKKIIQKLKSDHGFNQFYIFGHSYGTLSSKWLAKNIGSELAGSIHSASMTRPGGGAYSRYGNTASQIDMSSLQAPALNIHHGNDACPNTPYAAVEKYSNQNLVTVRGGVSTGDRCGAKHFHSYEGREQAASEAIIAWIINGEVRQFAGDE